MLTRTFFARAPLAPSRFAALPAGAITVIEGSYCCHNYHSISATTYGFDHW